MQVMQMNHIRIQFFYLRDKCFGGARGAKAVGVKESGAGNMQIVVETRANANGLIAIFCRATPESHCALMSLRHQHGVYAGREPPTSVNATN